MHMSPEQYRETRTRLGLSQAQVATLLGVDRTTPYKWEDGSRKVPAPVVMALALIGASGLKPHDAEQTAMVWLHANGRHA